MATRPGGDVTTDDFTTDQDLFYAAVKQEAHVAGSSQPALTPARVKEEPVDCDDEMSGCDDSPLGKANIPLQPFEQVFVDPSSVKTEPENESVGQSLTSVDPLLLPVKQEHGNVSLPFSAAVKEEVAEEKPCAVDFARDVCTEEFGNKSVRPHISTHGRDLFNIEEAVNTEAKRSEIRKSPASSVRGRVLMKKSERIRVRTQHEKVAVESKKKIAGSAGSGKQVGSVGRTGTKDRTTRLVSMKEAASSEAKRGEIRKSVASSVRSRVSVKKSERIHVRTQQEKFAVVSRKKIAGSAGRGKQVGSVGRTGSKDQALSMAGVMDSKKITESTTTQDHRVNGATCSDCGKVFDTKTLMKQHALSHTGKTLHQCSVCNFRALCRTALALHMRIHTGDKPYACSECDFRTAQGGNLAKHKRIHTGEKPYACTECDCRFTDSCRLTRHKRTHTGEKPYACTECDCRFADSSRLTRHKRTHNGEKPYACTECDCRYADSSHLTRHKRTHTGDKPYVCSECDCCFAYNNSLTRHKRTHTGEKPYACTECDCRFADSSRLTRHKRTHTASPTLAMLA